MKKQTHQFSYIIYGGIEELGDMDRLLLQQARELTSVSYAPYSRFHVASVAQLANGEIIKGTNQENASFPVGICAERSLLATAGVMFPNEIIETMAISYLPEEGKSNHPISPCGMCRQALVEYESRVQHPIRMILSGMEGPVYLIQTAKDLLPLAFDSENLQ